jgi:hypothetical protein
MTIKSKQTGGNKRIFKGEKHRRDCGSGMYIFTYRKCISKEIKKTMYDLSV